MFDKKSAFEHYLPPIPVEVSNEEGKTVELPSMTRAAAELGKYLTKELQKEVFVPPRLVHFLVRYQCSFADGPLKGYRIKTIEQPDKTSKSMREKDACEDGPTRSMR